MPAPAERLAYPASRGRRAGRKRPRNPLDYEGRFRLD
jgi:hypothetical protein